MVTITSANEALKNYYLDAVSEALNTKVNPLLAKIKKSTADVWGKDVRKLVRYGIAGGVSAGEEAGALPVPGAVRIHAEKFIRHGGNFRQGDPRFGGERRGVREYFKRRNAGSDQEFRI